MTMATVGRLAQRFGLSRTALLYYDRIGLLSPGERSAAGYRLYTEADVARLEKILLFRDVGLPLEAIGSLLGAAPGSVGEALCRLQRLQRNFASSGKSAAGPATHFRQLWELRYSVCNAGLLIEDAALQGLQRTSGNSGKCITGSATLLC